MSRPTDWWVLDLDGDPTPGSPDHVRTVAQRVQEFTELAHKVKTGVESLQGNDSVLAWIGQSGDAFREQFDELPGQLRKLYSSHQLLADALAGFVSKLELAQTQADRALADGRMARDRLLAARSSLQFAEGDLAAFKHHADALSKAATQPQPPDRYQVAQAIRDAEAAQRRLSDAQGLVSSAQSALDLAKRLAEQAKQMRDTAALECVKGIYHASDVGIQPRSFWDKLGDGRKETWKIIFETCKWTAVVAGVIACIIGGPLAWVALFAGAVVLLDAIIDYVHGKASVANLVVALLGVIPGVKGLTSVARLQEAGKAGGLKEIAETALASMRSTVSTMASAVKEFSAGAVNIVKLIADNPAVITNAASPMPSSPLRSSGSAARGW